MNTHHMDYTQASRRIGRVAALALFFFTVAYAIITTAGLISLKSPQEPIRDPFFFLMEVLIVVMAPLMVVVMVAVHISAERSVKAYSLTALAFMTVCAGLTSGVHFVVLTVGRQIAFTSISWMPLVLSFQWPSLVYALDILAWDWFYGLSMLFAAPVFKGGKLETAVRICMLVSGGLSLAGLIFLPFGNIQLRTIGILGYAGLSPVLFFLLAKVFGRAAASHSEGSGTKPRVRHRSLTIAAVMGE
jgi:hypothetical protein